MQLKLHLLLSSLALTIANPIEPDNHPNIDPAHNGNPGLNRLGGCNPTACESAVAQGVIGGAGCATIDQTKISCVIAAKDIFDATEECKGCIWDPVPQCAPDDQTAEMHMCGPGTGMQWPNGCIDRGQPKEATDVDLGNYYIAHCKPGKAGLVTGDDDKRCLRLCTDCHVQCKT